MELLKDSRNPVTEPNKATKHPMEHDTRVLSKTEQENRALMEQEHKEDLNDTRRKAEILLGENSCPAFLGVESACVHLFFNCLPDTSRADLHAQLEHAWVENRNGNY